MNIITIKAYNDRMIVKTGNQSMKLMRKKPQIRFTRIEIF